MPAHAGSLPGHAYLPACFLPHLLPFSHSDLIPPATHTFTHTPSLPTHRPACLPSIYNRHIAIHASLLLMLLHAFTGTWCSLAPSWLVGSAWCLPAACLPRTFAHPTCHARAHTTTPHTTCTASCALLHHLTLPAPFPSYTTPTLCCALCHDFPLPTYIRRCAPRTHTIHLRSFTYSGA